MHLHWHRPDHDPAPEEAVTMMEAVRKNVTHLVDTPELAYWLSDITIVRYLRARKWNVHKASDMLTHSIAWRKSHKPEAITFSEVESESKWGKLYILTNAEGKPVFDKFGRPILVIRTKNEHNISTKEDACRHFAYMMDLASELADRYAPDHKLSWLVDYTDFSFYKNSLPMTTVQELVRVLQNHYPERLGQVVCFRPPKIFSLFWSAVSPFLDEVTAKKVAFLGEKKLHEMDERFHVEQLEPAFGGSGCPEWELERWRKLVTQMEEEKRAAIKLGAQPPGTPLNLAAECHVKQ